MPKYEFDAVRWLRNVAEIQSHRAGAGPAMLRQNMLKCAEEIERLRKIISEATSAIGNGSGCSAQASVEFMAGLPKEIAMNTDALGARVARLEEALRFILNECDWEETMHEHGGDNRIGPAIQAVLEEK